MFDFANPNLVTGGRNTSTLATQALYLMNSPLVMEQATHAARRLLAEEGLDDPSRVALAHMRALGRPPTPRERALSLDYLRSFAADAAPGGTEPEEQRRLRAWSRLCQALFSCVDFRYLN